MSILKDPIRIELRKLLSSDTRPSFDEYSNFLMTHQEKLDIKYSNELVEYCMSKFIGSCPKATVADIGFEHGIKKASYWTSRGWTDIESVRKIKDVNSLRAIWSRKGMKPEEVEEKMKECGLQANKTYRNSGKYDPTKVGRSVKRYLERINPISGKLYTLDEAKEKCFTLQKRASDKRWEKFHLDPKFEQLNTRIEFYLAKGLSEDEARKALDDRQRKNGLEYYCNKYGIEEGSKKFAERMKIFGSKIKEDWKKQPWKRWKWGKRYSTASVNFFESIIESVPALLEYRCFFKENEFFLHKDGAIFFYDFCIKDLNLIVEYHGIKFHPKTPDDTSWKALYTDMTAHEKYHKDQDKLKLANDSGFEVIVVWEDEVTFKKAELIDELRKRIDSKSNS